MPRLFTAIEIPEPIRRRLALIRAPLSGAKWIEAKNMHVTLRFAGDIDERTADEFAGALDAVRCRPFQLSITGVGATLFTVRTRVATPTPPLSSVTVTVIV